MTGCGGKDILGRGTKAAPLRGGMQLHSGRRKLEKPSPTESPLRFLIFHTPGRIVHPARRVRWRLAATQERIEDWIEAMELLRVPVG